MRTLIVLILLITLFLFIGCSGNPAEVSPIPEQKSVSEAESSHSLWGLWQGTIDPAAQTIEFTSLREAGMHLNALPFLEPPALLNLTLDSVQFNGNIVDADIGLRHPFLGLTEFSGFDVCGIFITNGSVSGFDDANILMAGDGDTRLLNYDGLSRWWNPSEFPSGSGMQGYVDGLLGTPDGFGNFNATLNGYKYYCDDLSNISDTLADVTQANRGLFSAGQKNVRRFTIEMGNDGLVFNYAIDANWQFPDGNPPYAAPDDFGPGANRIEPWRIIVTEMDNTLWNDGVGSGGDLRLSIDVYDWFDAELNSVTVESPGNCPMSTALTPTGGGLGYSTYEIDIIDATPAETQIDLLVSIASEELDFAGFISGTNTSAYFMYSATVGNEAPAGCDPPQTPVQVDSVNAGYKPALAVDSNDVVHIAYAVNEHIYWSYSEDCGQTWTNQGSLYDPASGQRVLPNSLSMDVGITEPYIYLTWEERPLSGGGEQDVKIGRMPITPLGGALEIRTVMHRDYVSYGGWSDTQMAVMSDDDIMVMTLDYPSWNPEYTFVTDFMDFNGTYSNFEPDLAPGWITYWYIPYSRSLAGDSNGDCYLGVSGNYHPTGSPTWYGSFLLKYEQASDLWSWEYYNTHSGSNYYWDNRFNGLTIDSNDKLWWVSEYQTGGSGPYAQNTGTYTLTFAEGTAGSGYYAFTDPIPNHQRSVPGSGYPDAHYDYEWRYTVSPVVDSNGLCYIVYQDSINAPDCYYITYDGATWSHTASPIQLNTTMGAYMPMAVLGPSDWIFVAFNDRSTTPETIYFVAAKE